MNRAEIHGGLQRDEFVDQHGNVLGTAEYDLGDSAVRLRVIEFVEQMEARFKEFSEKVETMPNETLADFKAQAQLEVEFVGVLISGADAVFGEGFCEGAVGKGCRNVLTLMEMLNSIASNFGAQANVQLDRIVNGTRNREQRRIGKKK